MANAHGGYRKPEHPAPVSGPGKYSKRTDGQVVSTAPDQGYGDAKQQAAQQAIQPMQGKEPLPKPSAPSAGGTPGAAAYTGGDFMGPSARPGEPVTHGVDIGPGAGSAALTALPLPTGPQGTGYLTTLLQNMSATDATGILGGLASKAQAVNA